MSEMKLRFDSGGDGKRLLVLLHGLFATREVWQPMLSDAQARWQGTWLAPDLRGHGSSPHADGYALAQHASDVAALVQVCGEWDEIVVVGHSMGGVVALALGSGWFGIHPARALGLGIKVAWTEEELSRLDETVRAPVRFFETREEAIARYLKVSGLQGLVGADAKIARAGVVQEGERFRLCADPRAASIGAPPISALLAAAACPVHLARGQSDRMVDDDQLCAYDPASITLAGLGHNAMVEGPSAVWDWLDDAIRS